MRAFGANLARLRKQRGLSQYALARLVRCGQSTIGDLEAMRKDPSWRMAVRISSALDAPLSEFEKPVSTDTLPAEAIYA